MQKACVICSNGFEAKRKDVLYCSTKCKKASEYLRQEKFVKNCEHCGQTFETKRKETKYCSSSCSNTACKTHDDVTLSCKECGSDFIRKYIHRDKLFCSRSCATVHQNKIMFSDDEIKNKISETKKRQYETGEVVHPLLGKNLTAEHKQKLSDIKIKQGSWKGENNPAYGGQSKEVREKIKNSYFLHIQRGDYVNHPTQQIDYDTYYTKAISYILERDNNAHFTIISDDIEFCKTYSVLNNINKVFYNNTDPLVTIYFISLFYKGGICCNSTFSWWGSYLNNNRNKLVLFPNKWVNNDWIIDIYYEKSIIIEI